MVEFVVNICIVLCVVCATFCYFFASIFIGALLGFFEVSVERDEDEVCDGCGQYPHLHKPDEDEVL